MTTRLSLYTNTLHIQHCLWIRPPLSNLKSTFNTQNNWLCHSSKPKLPLKTNTALSLSYSSERDWVTEEGWFAQRNVLWSAAKEVSCYNTFQLRSSSNFSQPAQPSQTAGRAAGYDSRSTLRCREDWQPYLFMPAFLHQIWKRYDNPRSRLDWCVHCYAFFPHMGHNSTLSLSLPTSLPLPLLSLSLSLWPVTTEGALRSPPPWISHPPLPPLLLSLYAKSI